jgi:ABC-type multidrug transport system fused ATPase/permease subunit
VLDDPLSAVDTHTEHDLVSRLRPAVAGLTVIVATQRLSTLALADRAVVLGDGAVVEDGLPADLIEGKAAFASLFGDELDVA